MGGKDVEVAAQYLREVLRNHKKELIQPCVSALLDAVAGSQKSGAFPVRQALVDLLKFTDTACTSQNSSDKLTSLLSLLESAISTAKLSSDSPGSARRCTRANNNVVEVEEEEEEEEKDDEQRTLDALMHTLNLRQVSKFEPKFEGMSDDSDDEALTVKERKEERAEKHGKTTCEEEIEKMADGTEIRRKKTRTVNMQQSSKHVTITTRGGGGAAISRAFHDGDTNIDENEDFECNDFFKKRDPFERFRQKSSLLDDFDDATPSGLSTKKKTVQQSSEITQSVEEKKQKNGRLVADEAAHRIDATELNAHQTETFKGKQLLDRRGDGSYEESFVVRKGLPGVEPPPVNNTKNKKVVEYMQTFGGKNDNDEDFFRGTALASYITLNDNLRLHEEQFRKKLTFEFSSMGASNVTPDFSNLASLLQKNADQLEENMRLPSKFQDKDEQGLRPEDVQKAITFPERLAISGPVGVLECQDAIDYLVMWSENAKEKPYEVRGGPKDALIVFATQPRGSMSYQEAFIATYRTFVSSQELLQKLIKRYLYVSTRSDVFDQKAVRHTFSVIVRVVDELCRAELDTELVSTVNALVYRLIQDGNFAFSRLLRKRLHDRIDAASSSVSIPREIGKKSDSLFDFASSLVAAQMTYIDAKLFQAIDLAELLWWAQEDRKRCPNLLEFTEHFNRVSYWVRTLVLRPSEQREREKHFNKFIKILKQLRRLNNFNSYMAIVSALESSAVRRIDWPKAASDQLKEHSTIIDTAYSNRNYRQQLAKTAPPCVPYIGVTLTDLTFTHAGNPDKLPAERFEGRHELLNFNKRWVQYVILESIRSLKRWNYDLKLDRRVQAFFGGFSSYLSEDEVWALSEKIKPSQRKNK